MSESEIGELLYIPEVVAYKPEVVAAAYMKARTRVLEEGYKKDKYGSSVGENLIRIMDWTSDPRAARSEDDRATQRALKNFFDTYDTLFADFSDRLLTEKEDPEYKVQWAKFNQQLAQDMVVAYQTQEEDRLEGIKLFQELAMHLSGKDDIIFKEVKDRFNGAKVQAAMMNFFTEKGCLVLAPDPENDDEVRTLDVNNGTDFVVIKPNGNVILIDMRAKERFAVIDSSRDSQLRWMYNTALPVVLARYIDDNPDTKYMDNMQQFKNRQKLQQGMIEHVAIAVDPTTIDRTGKIQKSIYKQLEERFT